MKIIKVRSPFFVTVNEAGQIGSKVELFIWNKGTTEPTVPTYTLSKPIASINQIENKYNISNYAREFINFVYPDREIDITTQPNSNFAFCKVKRYKLVGTTYTLLDTVDYVCVDGYLYNDFNNQFIENVNYLVLRNSVIPNYNSDGFISVIAQRRVGFDFRVRYFNKALTLIDENIVITAGTGDEVFLFRIPYRSTLSTDDEQTVSVGYSDNSSVTKTIRIEECKYTPVACSFVNRLGGWEQITFFKQQVNSIAVKGSEYKLAENNKGSLNTKFNINGKQSVKLNTGFVDENYSELITDLLLSETVLLDGRPVTLKTQSSDLKTVLKDRMINYEIDFEYAFNLINDAV